MTGTASSFIDFNDNVSCKTHNINLLATWLFGKINTDCILTDITTSGGSALVPQNQPAPSALVDLVIMSPAKPYEALISIRAETRWMDDKFSMKHKKIGFEFHNKEQLEVHAIGSIIDLFLHADKPDIKCSILNN